MRISRENQASSALVTLLPYLERPGENSRFCEHRQKKPRVGFLRGGKSNAVRLSTNTSIKRKAHALVCSRIRHSGDVPSHWGRISAGRGTYRDGHAHGARRLVFLAE